MAQYGASGVNHGKLFASDQAQQMLDDYVGLCDNHNLRIGEVSDKGRFCEAAVATENG